MIKIKKGLDLPIHGAPEQKIYDAPKVTKVAVVGPDYSGMKPTMYVKVGDSVELGQVLFECKKISGVKYTSPGAGKVIEVNRGEKRYFQSIVIQLDSNESKKTFSKIDASSASSENVEQTLNESGLWASFKTRPFSKAPELGSRPNSIFVTAMDTNPLAANYDIIVNESINDFQSGLNALKKLSENVFVCVKQASTIKAEGVKLKEFSGVHPAGLAGTHIHFLDPVNEKKTNWSIDAQDVIAIGKLCNTGELDTSRIVAFSGPQVKQPRLLRTRLGANLSEITQDQLLGGETRIISGSAIFGRTSDKGVFDYLGRFSKQITGLLEGRNREFLGWHSPGLNKFSVKNIYVSALNRAKKFAFTTNRNGSDRAMVPIGMYEKVMPLDILPTQLLRSLLSNDTDYAQKLGVLELDEEDLALCTFVDPGKIDYGPILRQNLDTIEKEG